MDIRLNRFARAAAYGGTSVLLGASVLLTLAQQARTVGPWWLELSRYLPYPVLLAPGAVALVLTMVARLGRRWLAASLATLALTATLGMGLSWGRPDAGTVPLRFMTWNVKAYKAVLRPDGLAALGREVARQAPDVLVAQDTQGATGWLGQVAGPDGRPFGMPYSFRADQYLVASRYPLTNCVFEQLDPARLSSSAVRCGVEVDGIALTLVDVHFDSPRAGLNATRRDGLDGAEDWQENYIDRLWQSRLLASTLKNVRRPLILAGDLNAPDTSQVVRTLRLLGLRDAWASAMHGYGYSYGQALRLGFPFLRIDHVLVSPDVGVANVAMGAGDASDHRPVVADLWLRRR